MATQFYPGQVLQRGDLDIFLVDANQNPINAYEITYALYYVDPNTGQEVLIGDPQRVPVNPTLGQYYAALMVPPSATLGEYRVRWTIRQTAGSSPQTVVQSFEVIDQASAAVLYTDIQRHCIRKLRILLRDQWPDKYYHFRPPEHEGVINKFNRVFGYIWEDYELLEYLERAVDWWNMFPPNTGNLCSFEAMMQYRPEWCTAILWGAIIHAMFALAVNWVSEEFDYSIGGISLSIERSSKYESLKSNAEGQFDKATEAKARTVKIFRGLQQPRFGIGIRSAFGPYVGRGVLSPRNFIG